MILTTSATPPPGFPSDGIGSVASGLEEIEGGVVESHPTAVTVEKLQSTWGSGGTAGNKLDLAGTADWRFGMTKSFVKDVTRIDRKLQGRILAAMGCICRGPMRTVGDTVKPLSGPLKGLWRYRLGDFRLIYRPDPTSSEVVLLGFDSRSDSYE